MINTQNRIDLRLILEATLLSGKKVYIGPPCLRYFRWPQKEDQSCQGNYILLQWVDSENPNQNFRVHFNIHQQDQEYLYIVATKRFFAEGNIIKAPKSDIHYDEICFDIVNFVDIPLSQIQSVKCIHLDHEKFNRLTQKEIDELNQKTLQSISSPLIELKDISAEILKQNLNQQTQSDETLTKWLEIRQAIKQQRQSISTQSHDHFPKLLEPDTSIKTLQKVNKNKKNNIASFQQPVSIPQSSPVKSQGLGDSIKKLTNAFGIKQCDGCKKRQTWLNKIFPYKK